MRMSEGLIGLFSNPFLILPIQTEFGIKIKHYYYEIIVQGIIGSQPMRYIIPRHTELRIMPPIMSEI